jgi:ribosomal protein L24
MSHSFPTRRSSDLIDRETPIDLSNLMPYDPDKKKGVRISRVSEGDKKVRKSKASGKTLE